MPITHDGISCRLPPDPIRVVVGLLMLVGGGAAAWTGHYVVGAGLGFVALLVLVNQIGSRRVRVIETKLLVEDEHLLMALLIGPNRRRIGWEEVKSIHADNGALRVETTTGKPFVTAQGASAADIEALRVRAQAAFEKARKSA